MKNSVGGELQRLAMITRQANRIITSGFLALALSAATLLSAAPVRAQRTKAKAPPAAAAATDANEKPLENGGDEGDAPAVRVERGAGGKKVYRIEKEIRIEGKIQKPEAFYVLQKSGINYDWQELKQQFIPKILESVNKAPF